MSNLKLITTAILFSIASITNAQTKVIGKQTWDLKNLNVDKFKNGEAIPEAKTNEEWKQFGTERKAAWCYYNNDPANGALYGKLYNAYAVNDPRGLAPAGFHVPTKQEWDTLYAKCGGMYAAAAAMKSKTGWKAGDNGTNTSGFSGLPGGLRSRNGEFCCTTEACVWWMAKSFGGTELDWNSRFHLIMGVEKECGYSVRCM